MNTQTIVREHNFNLAGTGPRIPAGLYRFAHAAARHLAAAAACAALLTVSIWAATAIGFGMYLQAFNWSASFIFLALAFEVEKSSTALLAIASGIAILLLTALSTRFGLEYALWGTMLMCAWTAAGIIRR